MSGSGSAFGLTFGALLFQLCFAFGNLLIPLRVETRLLLRREHAAHDGTVHLVGDLVNGANTIFGADDEVREDTLFFELTCAGLDREDAVEIAFAIGRLIAVARAIPREDADGIEVPGQAILILVRQDEI